jgi:hypothetical protein
MDYVPGPIEAIRNSSLPEAGKQTRLATVCRWNGLAGPFWIDEKCIPPGLEYTPIGTRVENPSPQECFHKMLAKEQDDPRFEMTSLAPEVEEKKLHREALGFMYPPIVPATGLLRTIDYHKDLRC